MVSSSSKRLLQDSSSVPLVHNSVQNSLLLLHLHLSVVHFFYVQSHFTRCNIAVGAGSRIIITGENPPASSLHPYSDGDGIFG